MMFHSKYHPGVPIPTHASATPLGDTSGRESIRCRRPIIFPPSVFNDWGLSVVIGSHASCQVESPAKARSSGGWRSATVSPSPRAVDPYPTIAVVPQISCACSCGVGRSKGELGHIKRAGGSTACLPTLYFRSLEITVQS